MGDRCSGHCCRAFPLSVPYGDVLASARAVVAGKAVYEDSAGQVRGFLAGSVTIAEMLIPLGAFKVSPSSGYVYPEPRELFTCKHLLSNGDCAIYYRRPPLCSEYPYRGDPCDQPDCTWDDVKQRRMPPAGETLVQLKTRLGLGAPSDPGSEPA